MRLVLTRAAVRGLAKINPKMRAALVERLEAIAEQPFAAHRNVERINGERNAFRLRQGDWRAKYRIDHEAGEMRVLIVEPRGSVYDEGDPVTGGERRYGAAAARRLRSAGA